MQQPTDADALLGIADHFYFLNNGAAAAPLYARAEKLFSERGNARNELHSKVGRLRSEAETISFVELSRLAKGYTDIEIDYRATKRISPPVGLPGNTEPSYPKYSTRMRCSGSAKIKEVVANMAFAAWS